MMLPAANSTMYQWQSFYGSAVRLTAEARLLRIVALQDETLGLVFDPVSGDRWVVRHLLHKESGVVRRPFAVEQSK